MIPQKLSESTIIQFFKELVDAMAYMNQKSTPILTHNSSTET
jgi:hypothetical protein